MINADLIGALGGAAQLTTPALVVDRAALARNIAAMAARAQAAGLALRPHTKTHKCSAIGHLQMHAGAIGLCCATPRESLALLAAGFSKILLTSPVTQPRQAAGLVAALAQMRSGAEPDAQVPSMRADDFCVVVDSLPGLDLWERALIWTGLQISALVDVDIGMHRTGVADTGQAVELARRIDESPFLVYRGVQAYSGLVQHIPALAERGRVYRGQLGILDTTLRALREAGLAPEVVSGGGTGSFPIDAACGLFTESQAGSYVFMDVEYGAVNLADTPDEKALQPYEVSIWLRSHVISQNHPGQATVNAGTKCMSADSVAPQLRHHPDWQFQFFGDEYGRVVFDAAGAATADWGSTIDFVLPHCDPTVNLHDVYHIIEGNMLTGIWRIDARGVL